VTPTTTRGHESGPDQIVALFTRARLSPTQRRIARYVVSHLPESAFLSSVDLAGRAGVSQPSVTRFATALGFDGYPALRRALEPMVLGSAPVEPPASGAEARLALADEVANIESLARGLAATAAIDEVGAHLAGSIPVTVVGLRLSAGLATYFGYLAARIHPDVRLITHGGSAMYDALRYAQAAGGQWVLAFLMPRYPVETVELLRAARSIGLRVVAVADSPIVPFAADVDVVLPAQVGSRLVFDSLAAPMALAALLLNAMADAAPERTQSRLEEYEAMAQASGFLL
jgi:DNA-binding MurR/RpiR family transcriptional regulator